MVIKNFIQVADKGYPESRMTHYLCQTEDNSILLLLWTGIAFASPCGSKFYDVISYHSAAVKNGKLTMGVSHDIRD